MCYFIYVTAPAGQGEALRRAFEDLELTALGDSAWVAALHPQDETFVLTGNGCACGLYRPLDELVLDEAKARKKRLRKLKRRFRKHKDPQGRAERELEKSLAGRRDTGGLGYQVVSGCQRLRAAFDRMSILVRWESGDCSPAFDGEPEAIGLENLPDLAGRFREGVLYDITMAG